MSDSVEQGRRKQTRNASVVILVTMVLWMGASWVGGIMGWPVRFAFLSDLAALAALFWALVVLFRVWRAGQKDEGK